MKFIWVDKFENYNHFQYFIGRKNGATVEVYNDGNNKYWFYITRKADDFRFNSLWRSFPDDYIQNLLKELPDMIFNSDAEALDFVSNWVEINVPKIKKVNKSYN